jgi:hypothetical protein
VFLEPIDQARGGAGTQAHPLRQLGHAQCPRR